MLNIYLFIYSFIHLIDFILIFFIHSIKNWILKNNKKKNISYKDNFK